ncbi:hypothetical protein [Mariniradius saccharolyticus]|uniref:hypothetical protein n=1 Tax=Mariniradius saccharolyticus TaxID=1245591 RepID=UPI00058CA3AB|nr:hypothetical protein [Mariniradius saccharolyticus]
MAYSHVYGIMPFQTWPTTMSVRLRPFRHGLQPCLWDYALSGLERDVFPEKKAQGGVILQQGVSPLANNGDMVPKAQGGVIHFSAMAYNHVYEMVPFQTWPTAMSMRLRPFSHGLQPCLWYYALSGLG